MANILYLLRTFNDIDHITPIIWKTLREGDSAVIVFVDDYDYKNDYRLKFLRSNFFLQIYKFPLAYKLTKQNKFIFKLIREVFYNDFSCSSFLKKHMITSCVFEFGGSYGRDLRGHFFRTAKKNGIPTFCVPHGCYIFLNYDVNDHIKAIKEKTGKWPDFSKRSHFDYYVVQNPFHRQQSIDWGQDPEKTFAWGSVRFYPEWAKKNMEICPPFRASKNDKNKVKVVFMLPHWEYNVDKNRCIELILKLISHPWIYLIIKDHTRGTGGLPDELRKRCNSMCNVEASIPAHSPALINWSDVVINFGSSIGIEALLTRKQLINPFYLHTNKTIFEQTGASHSAKDHDEVLSLLQEFKKGKLPQIPDDNKKELFKQVIYGGKAEHDVLDYYWRKITLRK